MVPFNFKTDMRSKSFILFFQDQPGLPIQFRLWKYPTQRCKQKAETSTCFFNFKFVNSTPWLARKSGSFPIFLDIFHSISCKSSDNAPTSFGKRNLARRSSSSSRSETNWRWSGIFSCMGKWMNWIQMTSICIVLSWHRKSTRLLRVVVSKQSSSSVVDPGTRSSQFHSWKPSSSLGVLRRQTACPREPASNHPNWLVKRTPKPLTCTLTSIFYPCLWGQLTWLRIRATFAVQYRVDKVRAERLWSGYFSANGPFKEPCT